MKLKLLVDIDNVICGFAELMVEYLNFRYRCAYKFKDYIVWDFVYNDEVKLTKDQFYQAFDEFVEIGFWDSIDIYKDVPKVLQKLFKLHDIIYLSSRPESAKRKTIQYFEKHKIPFNGCTILREPDQHIKWGHIVLCPGLNKGTIAKHIEADLAIEDQPRTIQDYINEGINVVQRLQPYNEDSRFEDPHGLVSTCRSFKGFAKIVHQLAKRLQLPFVRDEEGNLKRSSKAKKKGKKHG